ncbi:TetR/AcrR family transcriptional regulator [Vallicoccus soli]|uniref:TetR family transcriptional regulator n=1 Tax=Vallicoccus soli TaxID=2339232 RepID=A0A3A3YX75_9ACTN|nr:TetR family transcriptional regulator [Vallicoccus soli]RJK94868.1 TetR family transcriptional regulator [Vallicoccus soli]
MSTAPVRRARRHDPQRRERIVAAALDVIAEHGVEGASHRAIARAADVPLGSTTYHFSTSEELLVAAFTALADRVASQYEARLAGARDTEEALEGLAQHLCADLLGSERDLVLSLELYAAAARRPEMRSITEAWMRRSRAALERFLDPVTARELDALVEGLVLHSALSTDPMTPDQVRHALRRLAR